MRTLVGSVGYFNLSDLSAGLFVAEALGKEDLAGDVDVVDLSYGGPIAAVHRLKESRPAYDRLVLVGSRATDASGGAYRWYRWSGDMPRPEDVQRRIAEAVTGVLDLESYPIIAQQFGALPKDVRIVEIDPVETGAGLEPSETVKRILPQVCRLVRDLAEER